MLKRSTLALCVILLLATFLRFYRIEAQSLWADEGSSVAQALRDVPTIVANSARDIHPPLYYILLHFWVMLFGTSEAGMRSLSAVLGVALVWLCYRLGRELRDERTGLIAALLAAVNPFQVYYAQEARMYMLMALLGALCVFATLRGRRTADGRRQRWYAIYLVAAVMGLYTHYFFAIVLVVCNVIFLMADWQNHQDTKTLRHQEKTLGLRVFGASWLTWFLMQAIALLAFLPWLPTAVRQIGTWPSGAQTFAAADAPLVILRTLSEGLSAPRDDGLWLALFGVLLAVGIGTQVHKYTGTQGTRPGYLFTCVLVYLFAPVAVMFALALFKDAFLKFLLVASPPFILLVANGISQIANRASRITFHASRFTSVLLLLLLTFPSTRSLQNYYFDSHFARDDYRSIAQTIDALARGGDAIILDAPGQQEIFTYYYRGALPMVPLPRQRPLDAAATESELASIAAQRARVFVVFWATDESDPSRVIESWLDAHAFKASDTWYGNVRLAMYASQKVNAQTARQVDVRWGDGITLESYALGAPTMSAGDVLPLRLFWRADQPPSKRYKVFVHLLDPRGFVVAQRDSEPVGGSRPTNSWKASEQIADPYGLFIPLGTPPLQYTIEVGLYDPDNGQRLQTPRGDDHLLLDPITVQPTTAPLAAYGMTPIEARSTQGVELIGYRLDKVGAEGQRDVIFHAGDAIHLTLFWRKTAALASDSEYRWQLGAFSKQTTPTDGLYSVSQWSVGEVVRDDQIIAMPSDWRAGRYALEVDGKPISEVEVR